MKIKKVNEMNENNNTLKNFLMKKIEEVKIGGGNALNLKEESGLEDLATFIDSYNESTPHIYLSGDIIYTKKTIDLYKELVESMVVDEIENNQFDKE